MSRFTPVNITIDSPQAPDVLAGAVLNGLSRPIGQKQSWSVVKALILGVATFGVVPLLAWMRGFRAFVIGEQQQFLHLARWVRQNSEHPLSRQLESDASELRTGGFLTFVSLIALFATVLAIWNIIDRSGRMPEHALIAGTYGYGQSRIMDYTVRPFADAGRIFTIWFWGLSIAYGFHWLQVTLHSADIRRFVDRFSQIAQSEGVNRVRADPLGTTLRPLWLGAAVCMILVHAPWGLLMMLAGAAQRRYITWSGRNTRADVAHRLRAMLMRRRPNMLIPMPVYLRERCIADRCRAELPRGANFCRRCGTKQRTELDRVA